MADHAGKAREVLVWCRRIGERTPQTSAAFAAAVQAIVAWAEGHAAR